VAQAELLLRCLLAVVYCAAAVGKLLSAGSSDRLIETFQLPPRLRPTVSALAPVELIVAGALVFPPTARAAGVVSCALLILFSVFIVRNLRHGRSGECNCFGRLHTSVVGSRSLIRNIVLTAASGLVVVSSGQPHPSVLLSELESVGSNLWIDLVGGVVATVATAAILVNRSRRDPSTVILGRRARAVAVGGRAQADLPTPDPFSVRVTSLDRQSRTFGDYLVGDQRNILVFIDPACGPCRSLLPAAPSWFSDTTHRVLLVSRGPVDLNRELLSELPESRVLIDTDGALMHHFDVRATPSAVALSAAGAGVETRVLGPSAIENLIAKSAEYPKAPWSEIEPAIQLDQGEGEGFDRLSTALGFPLQRVLSRRETLSAGISSAFLAMVIPHLGRAGNVTAKFLKATQNGVSCPSCGTCMICETSSAQPQTLSCRPCKQKCTANDLCANYANKLPSYVAISSYLLDHGFEQDGDSMALGLQQNGTLSFIGTNTGFTGKSSASPAALLMYSLNNTTGSASAAIFDSQGRITSVITTNSTGQVVSVSVPVSPTLSSSTVVLPRLAHESGRDADSRANLEAAEPASCTEVCSTELKVFLGAFTALAAPEEEIGKQTIKLVLPLIQGVISSLTDGGFQTDTAMGVAGSALTAATIANLAKSVGNDIVSSSAEKIICETLICNIKLEGCCNYTGTCYDLDEVCEQNCPGGLAHPLAHCDVYLSRNGQKIKVSSLISI
jgi:Methylamine utilisation protein MauE